MGGSQQSGVGTITRIQLENFMCHSSLQIELGESASGSVSSWSKRKFIVSLVYPLFASVRAIETKSLVDDQQWLTYWVLYSLITLAELTFVKVIEWIPIWLYVKLIFTYWLVIPYFSGIAYVHEHYVRPVFINPQTINVWYVPKKKDVFSRPDDIIAIVEKYIKENGPEAFEKLVHRADYSKRNSYKLFD